MQCVNSSCTMQAYHHPDSAQFCDFWLIHPSVLSMVQCHCSCSSRPSVPTMVEEEEGADLVAGVMVGVLVGMAGVAVGTGVDFKGGALQAQVQAHSQMILS